MKPKAIIYSLLLVVSAMLFNKADVSTFEVYTDRHGTWRVPTDGLPTRLTQYFIEKMPRIDNSFLQVDIQFDMENETYFSSSAMYILIIGLFGLIYFLFVAAFFLGRYAFDGCGGKKLPRRGYKESSVNCTRAFLIAFSFILEGVLIYGYFANTDLHTSMGILVDEFQAVSSNITEKIDQLHPPATINYVGYNQTMFQDDLQFSARFAHARTSNMKQTLDNYETYRMLLILFNLVLSTIGCAVGIAAGSVRRSLPVVIMLALLGLAGTLIFFSFGAHFAAAKILYEYCEEIPYYIDPSNDDFLPMRLQYFYPCVSSPVLQFLWDSFAFGATSAIEKFRLAAVSTPPTDAKYDPKYAQWFNISSPEYNKMSGEDTYKTAVNESNLLQIIDESKTCRSTKAEMRADNFLMCTYARDNLNMIMIAQGTAAVLIIIMTFIGIPAIKKFQWSGNVPGMGAVLAGDQQFQGKPARAKRAI